jgi:hypothetical protein
MSMTWCSRVSTVPGFVLASSAIHRRFVDRFAGLLSLPVFPVDGSLLATPPFPPSGPGESWFPALVSTMKALRLPIRLSPVAHWFAPAAHTIPPRFVFAAALPGGRRGLQGQGFGWAGCPYFRRPRVDTNGFSQVFRRSFPCLCSAPGPRSNRRALAVDGHVDAAPAGWTAKASAMSDFGAITQLRHPLTYASRARCRTHARLASGWSAYLCREGVEPSGSRWKVSARVDGHPPPLLS